MTDESPDLQHALAVAIEAAQDAAAIVRAGWQRLDTIAVDAKGRGDVVTDIDALSIVDQQWAAGFGLYIKLFGLKVGASIGERLNHRQPNPDGEWFKNRSWHIAVGDTY